MTWDQDLEGNALNIAGANDERLRVMAGPGTGKSFALQRRVARLLEEGQMPHRILVVTFTRTAAASLVRDLKDIGVPGCERVEVSTLHSFCFKLLNQQRVFTYLGRVARHLITFDKNKAMQFEGRPLLADIILANGELGAYKACTKRIRAFEAAWARMQTDDPGWATNSLDKSMQDHLLAWLKFHQCMLIGELVPEALRYIANNPMSDVLGSYDHVIVDEYQDLNRAEQEIIDLLGEAGCVSIVGDVDQSIYSFRHANPEGISDFGNRHPDTRDETLEECRRCPTRVVKIANHLIGINYSDSFVPRLIERSENPQGDVSIVQWTNAQEEIEGIARYVEHMVEERGFSPSDILVLSPRRRLAYRLRDELGDKSIPAHSFYREEALEEPSAQEGMAILTLLKNPDDRPSLRWWLGRHSGTQLRGEYRRLRTFCEENDHSPREALELLVQGGQDLRGVSRLVSAYCDLKNLVAELDGSELGGIIEKLFPSDDPGCAPINSMATAIVPQCETIADLHDGLTTYITQPEEPEGDFLRVMSLQKAKGLTSPIVIVMSCIEGLLPNLDSDWTQRELDAAIEEQRRLFYVAVTRCTNVLVVSAFGKISTSESKRLGAQVAAGGSAITSRYVGEVGPEAPGVKRGRHWMDSGFLS